MSSGSSIHFVMRCRSCREVLQCRAIHISSLHRGRCATCRCGPGGRRISWLKVEYGGSSNYEGLGLPDRVNTAWSDEGFTAADPACTEGTNRSLACSLGRSDLEARLVSAWSAGQGRKTLEVEKPQSCGALKGRQALARVASPWRASPWRPEPQRCKPWKGDRCQPGAQAPRNVCVV